MQIIYISIFPEIFSSFEETSLIAKAIEADLLTCTHINPRGFCTDKHKQIDDYPYGGGAGLVIKAQPYIDALQSVTDHIDTDAYKIVLLGPSNNCFSQHTAHAYADLDALIFVCGRYEGIDHRFSLWAAETYGERFQKMSLGPFVTLGGELPAMTMTESVVRLLPGVLGDEESRKHESYRPEQGGKNLEHPHYTRPQTVAGYDVPEVLLSGNHAAIEQWRLDSSQDI